MPISTATPKNGARQLIEPSTAPTSGPTDNPMPSAASYSVTAFSAPPRATAMIAASAVAMNKALPRPQPARQPTRAATESDVPASAENTMITTRPIISVVRPPNLLEAKDVTSMATAVTSR